LVDTDLLATELRGCLSKAIDNCVFTEQTKTEDEVLKLEINQNSGVVNLDDLTQDRK
jgi:hypothetical protein